MADIEAMRQALENLTVQNDFLAQQMQNMQQARTGGGGKGDTLERFKNIGLFARDQREYEECAAKSRSQVSAGGAEVGRLLVAVENDCAAEELANGSYLECRPEFDGGAQISSSKFRRRCSISF